MEGSIKNIILGVVVALILFSSGFLTRQCTYKAPEPEIRSDTTILVVHDTTKITEFIEVQKEVRDSILVPVTEFQVVHDTTFIPLPREYVTYQDSSYKAVVSGFMPRLEELTMYPKKEVVTIQTEKVYTEYKRYKFGVGIQAGYGITPSGFQPYLGVGLSYNLFGF